MFAPLRKRRNLSQTGQEATKSLLLVNCDLLADLKGEKLPYFGLNTCVIIFVID